MERRFSDNNLFKDRKIRYFNFRKLLKRPVGPEDTQPNGKRSAALGRMASGRGRLVKAKAFLVGIGSQA